MPPRLTPLSLSPLASRLAVGIVLALLGSLTPDSARAQAVTERPLSGMQYFAVHNAFQRSIPEVPIWIGNTNIIDLKEQVDQYNVWHMELDIYWRYWEDGFVLPANEQYIEVGHTCIDNRGRLPLLNHLGKLAASRRVTEGFFVVTFQLTHNSDRFSPTCLLGGFSENGQPGDFELMRRANTQILSLFAASAIYTADDFVADGRVWPSPQELIARGKHITFYTDMEPPGETVLLSSPGTPNQSKGFWKLHAQNGSIAAWNPSDRAIYRFPDDFSEVAAKWETAMTNCVQRPALPPFTGEENYCMTFVGTTIMGDHEDDLRFHPPLPMYISATPSATTTAGRGTYLEPYQGITRENALLAGLDRVANFEFLTKKKSTITIKVDAGTYDLSRITTVPIEQSVRIIRNPATPGVVLLK